MKAVYLANPDVEQPYYNNTAITPYWININYRALYNKFFTIDGWEAGHYNDLQPSIQLHHAKLYALNDFNIKF